jgi:hypothetical protein
MSRLVTLEMGKLVQQSACEVALRAAILEYCAKQAEALHALENLAMGKDEAVVESAPISVALGIDAPNPAFKKTNSSGPSNCCLGWRLKTLPWRWPTTRLSEASRIRAMAASCRSRVSRSS